MLLGSREFEIQQARLKAEQRQAIYACTFHLEGIRMSKGRGKMFWKDCLDEVMVEFPSAFIKAVRPYRGTKLMEYLDDTLRAANSRLRTIKIPVGR